MGMSAYELTSQRFDDTPTLCLHPARDAASTSKKVHLSGGSSNKVVIRNILLDLVQGRSLVLPLVKVLVQHVELPAKAVHEMRRLRNGGRVPFECKISCLALAYGSCV